MNVNQSEAHRFLRLLDPEAKSFTFQTFDDGESKRPELARVIHSPAFPDLVRMHANGAGIFAAVNATDGRGRRAENIARIRCVYQDDDNGFSGTFPLEPSMVVETSPGRFQRYWLVADVWLPDAQGRADFDNVMGRMIESYGNDKGAKDLARVLRVPGFWHRKGEPHPVRIVEASGKRYTRAEIIAAFPPAERPKTNGAHHEWKPRDNDDERIRDALRYINADDRPVWLECGMAIKAHLGDGGRPLWDDWSRQSSKFNQRDQDTTWRGFRRNGIAIGTLFHHAKQGGWQGTWSADGPRAQIVEVADAPEVDLVLGDAALYGLAGDVVNTILPHTESDPVALLIQFLTMFGNVVGPSPYYLVESDKHRANIFAVLVGASAKGRKGTSAGRVTDALSLADESWAKDRTVSGLSSGEGLIDAVRDEVRKWDAKEHCEVVVDPGARDKRLLVTEPEFAGALSVMDRHGNTLSPTIRNAWGWQTFTDANSELAA